MYDYSLDSETVLRRNIYQEDTVKSLNIKTARSKQTAETDQTAPLRKTVPGCSKLMTLLVNVSLKFCINISNTPIFSVKKNVRSF